MSEEKKLYHEAADYQYEHEEILLGGPTSYSLVNDPKHIAFVLSRYKFVAKMLEGKKSILEIGCGDGIGMPLVAKITDKMFCIDWEQRPLDTIKRRLGKFYPNVDFKRCDPTKESIDVNVEAAFSIDFLEHINSKNEEKVLENIVKCLPKNGVLITGTPNITTSKYASPCSEIQHINLKSMETLKHSMEKYFENVFMFGMNDEVLHTGYAPMCHYIWSVAAGVKTKSIKSK